MTEASRNAKFYQRREISAGSDRNSAVLIVMAFIWPAAAGVAAFFMLHLRVARFVLGAVMVLIGYRLALVDVRFDAYDLGRYVAYIADLNFVQFSRWVSTYCFHSEQCIDPVQPFYVFFLTRFSSETPIAFAGFALVFAILSISTLAAVHRDKAPGSVLFVYIFLFAVMAANPITNIGGFRFNTASWAFLLGGYLVFYRGRDVGFAFILLSVALHYAMFLPLALATAFRFVQVPLRLSIFLALASFVVSGGANLIAPLLDQDWQLGALERGARYVGEDKLNARANALNNASSSNLFFFIFAYTGIKIVVGLWLGYLLLWKKEFKKIGVCEIRLLSFSLALFALSNTFSSIPSFDRYVIMAIQLLFICFVVCADFYNRREKSLLIFLFVPAILFSMLFTLRVGLGLVDLFSIMPSPFLALDRVPIW